MRCTPFPLPPSTPPQPTTVLQCMSVITKQVTADTVMAWARQPGNSPDQLGQAEAFVHVLARWAVCVCV